MDSFHEFRWLMLRFSYSKMKDELMVYNELDVRTPQLLKQEFREKIMIALSSKFKTDDGKYRYKGIKKKRIT